MDPSFEALPPATPPPPAKPKSPAFGGALGALAVLLLKFKTVLSMAFSIWLYSKFWGWPFAVGVVLLLLIHEMGHFAAAKMLGLPVSAPLFIPFMGAGVYLKEHPRDAWTSALVAYGGPLVGTFGSMAFWYAALQWHIPVLMVVARAGFFINLFNLIPLPPLDGGNICAAISPWFWITGLLLFVASFFFFQFSSIAFVIGAIVLIVALPRLQQTLFQPLTPELQTYYATHASNRRTMALLYLGLIAALLLGLWDANAHLSAIEN